MNLSALARTEQNSINQHVALTTTESSYPFVSSGYSAQCLCTVCYEMRMPESDGFTCNAWSSSRKPRKLYLTCLTSQKIKCIWLALSHLTVRPAYTRCACLAPCDYCPSRNPSQVVESLLALYILTVDANFNCKAELRMLRQRRYTLQSLPNTACD